MPRYVVTTRRGRRNVAMSALEVVTGEPGITAINATDPHMITIEASDEVANQLRTKLADSHFVEPEVHRSLN